VIEAQLAVAAGGQGQLPELFAGFDRASIPVPASYPASCSPQAWAAASPLLWLRTILGLEPWAPGRQVWLSPALPRSIRRLCVDDLQIGGSRLSVDIAGDDVEVRCDGDLGVVRERRVPMSAIIRSS
jgi:glycogen debranching enzyme